MARFRTQQAGRVDIGRDTCAMSYTANLPASCAMCSQLIWPGERFTRGHAPGRGAATYIMCRSCRAFRERSQPADGAPREEECEHCEGTGQMVWRSFEVAGGVSEECTCDWCGGTGKQTKGGTAG